MSEHSYRTRHPLVMSSYRIRWANQVAQHTYWYGMPRALHARAPGDVSAWRSAWSTGMVWSDVGAVVLRQKRAVGRSKEQVSLMYHCLHGAWVKPWGQGGLQTASLLRGTISVPCSYTATEKPGERYDLRLNVSTAQIKGSVTTF